jgi:steroid delta-isomerase-like uncharacterized protein
MSEYNTQEANKALIRRWFEEVWNQGRADSIPKLFAENGIAHGLSDDAQNPLRGPAGFLPFHAQFRSAFPNIEVIVEDQVAERDLVATRCTVRGKHTGDALGIAATHSAVDFSGMTITRIADGKIIEAWNNFDFMRMYRQLGTL